MGRAVTPANRLARLSSVLDGARSMLIIVQNTPDPDAIAAAAALRELANERHEIACSIGHSGGIWRAENLALLRYLSLNTRPLSDLDLEIQAWLQKNKLIRYLCVHLLICRNVDTKD